MPKIDFWQINHLIRAAKLNFGTFGKASEHIKIKTLDNFAIVVYIIQAIIVLESTKFLEGGGRDKFLTCV